MLKGHPKGLVVLFLSNMGERFGYYTMFAIFVLYLQEHFAWTKGAAGSTFGILTAGTYIAALIGGFVADRYLGYGKTVLIGLIVMAAGYGFLAKPIGASPILIYVAMATLALGVGLFKGNIAVITGNLYDDKKYSHLRDSAFNIFYMGINIGAFFAPYTANALKNLMLHQKGFTYQAEIPKICHDVLGGDLTNIELLKKAAEGTGITDMKVFATQYIESLSHGYNLGFAAAGVAMLISLVIFIVFKKYYKHADVLHKDKAPEEGAVEMSPKQVKDRMIALAIVFIAAIAFFMALTLAGAPLTFFAKSYTQLTGLSKFTNLLFTLPTLISIAAILLCLGIIFKKSGTTNSRIIAAVIALCGGGVIWYYLGTFPEKNNIGPELFQTFNPVYIVFLTPIIVGLFAYLNNLKKEPSAPVKMIYGFAITAVAFVVLLVSSIGLPTADKLVGGVVESSLAVSPYYLIVFYFGLTLGELFLSPIGLSFVSKVAPPKLKGSMQAGWLVSMGIGAYLAGASSGLFDKLTMLQYFVIMIGCMVLAGGLLLIFLKKINRSTAD